METENKLALPHDNRRCFFFYLNLRFVDAYPTEIFFLPIGRFWELLVGSLLAWITVYKTQSLINFWASIEDKIQEIPLPSFKKSKYYLSEITSIPGLALLSWGVIGLDESYVFPSIWAVVPVLGSVLIIVSGSRSKTNRLLFMNPIAIWFGLISYPLYLWHWPILSFLQIIEGETSSAEARSMAVCLSVLLAWLTYKFIEYPIRFGLLRDKVNSMVIGFVLLLLELPGCGSVTKIGQRPTLTKI